MVLGFDDFNTRDAPGARGLIDDLNLTTLVLLPPADVTSLVAFPRSGGLVINWVASATATSYRATATNADGVVRRYTIPSGTTTAFTAYALTDDETWTVEVFAINAAGESDGVSVAEDTDSTAEVAIENGGSLVLAIPGAPVLASLVESDGAIGAVWTAPVDDGGTAITGYVVRAESFDEAIEVTFTSPVLHGTAGPLVNDAEYSITVAAVNSEGQGPWSNALLGTPEEGLDPIDPPPDEEEPEGPPPETPLHEPVYWAFPPGRVIRPANFAKALVEVAVGG